MAVQPRFGHRQRVQILPVEGAYTGFSPRILPTSKTSQEAPKSWRGGGDSVLLCSWIADKTSGESSSELRLCQSNGEGSPLRESRARWSDETVRERGQLRDCDGDDNDNDNSDSDDDEALSKADISPAQAKCSIIFGVEKYKEFSERFLQGYRSNRRGLPA